MAGNETEPVNQGMPVRRETGKLEAATSSSLQSKPVTMYGTSFEVRPSETFQE